ncbi:hypothetical protein IPF89_00895 [Candidatus Saccharibacteria bacterium]|nr:MAG: hypothetical protein IPF89_00895 [Candidatus Saccharibacteria bacterium]
MFSDPSATVTVTVNGTTYNATNNGDGTWSLSAGTIAPALNLVHDIVVSLPMYWAIHPPTQRQTDILSVVMPTYQR